MKPAAGPPAGLRSIPSAPPSYRLKRTEPTARHGFHVFMCVRDLTYAAVREQLSLATVAVLTEYALRTDVDGVTKASVREVARHLNRSPGIVQRHVKRLGELGFMVQLGGCREDNRHRLWRIAGMDRREKLDAESVENLHRGAATSRARGARHASTSRAPGARISAPLPGELLEPTRAPQQQGDAAAGAGWGTARPVHREGLDSVRAVLGRCGGPGAPRGPSDDAQEPDGAAGAENATERPDAGAA